MRLRGGVEFRQQIPKSASGKILRRLLRDEIKQKTAAKAKLWRIQAVTQPEPNCDTATVKLWRSQYQTVRQPKLHCHAAKAELWRSKKKKRKKKKSATVTQNNYKKKKNSAQTKLWRSQSQTVTQPELDCDAARARLWRSQS